LIDLSLQGKVTAFAIDPGSTAPQKVKAHFSMKERRITVRGKPRNKLQFEVFEYRIVK
jgi:hypothetical protein